MGQSCTKTKKANHNSNNKECKATLNNKLDASACTSGGGDWHNDNELRPADDNNNNSCRQHVQIACNTSCKHDDVSIFVDDHHHPHHHHNHQQLTSLQSILSSDNSHEEEDEEEEEEEETAVSSIDELPLDKELLDALQSISKLKQPLTNNNTNGISKIENNTKLSFSKPTTTTPAIINRNHYQKETIASSLKKNQKQLLHQKQPTFIKNKSSIISGNELHRKSCSPSSSTTAVALQSCINSHNKQAMRSEVFLVPHTNSVTDLSSSQFLLKLKTICNELKCHISIQTKEIIPNCFRNVLVIVAANRKMLKQSVQRLDEVLQWSLMSQLEL